MHFSIAIFFIVTLTAIHPGSGLECYSCTSQSDPACMDADKLEPFKSDCNAKAIEDAKKAFNSVSHALSDWGNVFGLNLGKTTIDAEMVCQKVDIESKGHTHTLRSCSLAKKDNDDMCDFLKSKMKSDSIKVRHCSLCKDNLCNSSSGVSTSLLSILIALVAVHFYQQ